MPIRGMIKQLVACPVLDSLHNSNCNTYCCYPLNSNTNIQTENAQRLLKNMQEIILSNVYNSYIDKGTFIPTYITNGKADCK